MLRRTMLTAVVLTFCWTGGAAYAAEATSEQGELQKFQGTWAMVSGELDGKPAGDQHVKQSRITYSGKTIRISVPNQHGETIVADIVKIDPTKAPKEMHFIRRNGPSAGKTLIGIYEFNGDDQYKFALDPGGNTVLKKFATKAGSGHLRNSWKRVKP